MDTFSGKPVVLMVGYAGSGGSFFRTIMYMEGYRGADKIIRSLMTSLRLLE